MKLDNRCIVGRVELSDDSQAQCEKARQPMSHDIIDFATILAKRSEELATYCEASLSPLVIPCPNKSNDKSLESKPYPPLFAEINTHLCRIEQSLNHIK